MNDKQGTSEDYRTLQLMSELEQNDSLSQRELAGRLGIAVGLVNSYLKNLAAKGFLRIKNYPRNRYAYLLTPKGLAEKSRLAYQHINYFNNLYTIVRQDYQALFKALREQGHEQITFCGVDEVAEIAYLSLQESGLSLGTVVDSTSEADMFVGNPVQSLDAWVFDDITPVVLTSLKRRTELRQSLLEKGMSEGQIYAPNS